MFETSQVQARALTRGGRTRLLTASIALHSLVIVGAIGASIASVDFPSDAPDQVAPLQLVARVALPPAGPPPQRRSEPQQSVERPRVQTVPVAPEVIPDTVTPVQSTGGSIAESTATGEGTPDGVAGGDPDGVAGGIPGIGEGGGTGTVPVEDITYQVGGEVTAPRVLTRVTPEYPAIAARTGLRGVVVVECIVDRQGKIRDVSVVRSSFAAFEQSAVAAVRQWTFAPGTYRGKAVDTIFNLTVTFSVSNGR